MADTATELDSPARGPQRPPAGGGHVRRGAAADPRRRRLGQDPRADPPDRLPGRDRRRQAERDPRDHVHEQGGGGDARPGRAARRPARARDVGDDVPLRLRADAARPRRQARVHAPVHDLRPGRLAAADQALPGRARDRPQAVHARRRSTTRSPTPRTSSATPTRTRRWSGRSSSRPSPTSTAPTSASCTG